MSFVLIEHDRQERTYAVHDSVQIDVDDPVPHTHRSGPLIANTRNAGVVTQHVRGTIFFEGLAGKLFDAFAQRHINRDRENIGTILGEFGFNVAQFDLINIGQNDLHTRCNETIGHGTTNTARCSRNDGYLAL